MFFSLPVIFATFFFLTLFSAASQTTPAISFTQILFEDWPDGSGHDCRHFYLGWWCSLFWRSWPILSWDRFRIFTLGNSGKSEFAVCHPAMECGREHPPVQYGIDNHRYLWARFQLDIRLDFFLQSLGRRWTSLDFQRQGEDPPSRRSRHQN